MHLFAYLDVSVMPVGGNGRHGRHGQQHRQTKKYYTIQPHPDVVHYQLDDAVAWRSRKALQKLANPFALFRPALSSWLQKFSFLRFSSGRICTISCNFSGLGYRINYNNSEIWAFSHSRTRKCLEVCVMNPGEPDFVFMLFLSLASALKWGVP